MSPILSMDGPGYLQLSWNKRPNFVKSMIGLILIEFFWVGSRSSGARPLCSFNMTWANFILGLRIIKKSSIGFDLI